MFYRLRLYHAYLFIVPPTNVSLKAPNVYFTSDEGHNHLSIKNYQTDMQHGSYISNKTTYLYDNYTLTKGNKVIKIIVSYLKDDDLLSNYADIVSQSIFSNKQRI